MSRRQADEEGREGAAAAESDARLQARITNLEHSLEGDYLESPELAAALEALGRLSDEAYRLDREVLGTSGETIADRANRAAVRYQERGLLPEGVEPVARGYVPHSEEVSVDPGEVLSNLVRQLNHYWFTLEALEQLYANGRPIREGEPVPKGMMLVRNPDTLRSDIPENMRAAIRFPEYGELTGRAGGSPNSETFAAWVDLWLYRGGEAPKPVWVDDVANVRMLPKGIVKTRLPDLFRSARRRRFGLF